MYKYLNSAVDCDIRIQLLSIAEEHVKISRNEHGQVRMITIRVYLNFS